MQSVVRLSDIAEKRLDRRKLAAVLHADMVGYSRLIGLDDAGTAARLWRLRRELIDPTIARNGGTIRNTAGDSLLVLFDSIDGAVQSAISIQRGITAIDTDTSQDQRIRFRIGINIGDAILEDVDIFGDSINIAVRLETACPPGGICVSRAVRDHARYQQGLWFEGLGRLTLKNISRPVEAFILHFDEMPAKGNVATVRHFLEHCFRVGRLRRMGLAPTLVLIAIITAVATFYAGESSLPQRQEAARAEARHAEEMERLQALNATERAMAETLAREKGVPVAALTQILARLGEAAKANDPVEVQTQLEQKAIEFMALRQQVLMLSIDDPKVAGLHKEADAALDKADFTLARTKLLDASNVDRAAALAMADKAMQRSLAAARSLQESARVAALTLHYRDAAGDLGSAVALAKPYDQQQARLLMTMQAEMLRSQGVEFGDNSALVTSIGLYKQVLLLVQRDEDAQGWATTQYELGIALWRLGQREVGVGSLNEAIVGLRAALEERTRDRVPLDWAKTQNALGNALLALGSRESGLGHLQEAVAAYRAALEEQMRDPALPDCACTRNNLGNALHALGSRESGTMRLEEAVAAYRTALEVRTRDRMPLDWAMTQSNLGNALLTLGLRESGTARLEEAVAASRASLEVRTRDRVPLDWAQTQNNLGNGLRALGERQSGTVRLQEAVAAYRAALEERARDRVPLDWAQTQNNLGNALRALGSREKETGRLKDAVAALRSALEERTRDRVPLDWAQTQHNLGLALFALDDRERDSELLGQAVVAYRSALQVRTLRDTPLDWAWSQNNLGLTLSQLAQREGGTSQLEEALIAYNAALDGFTAAGMTANADRCRVSRDKTLTLLAQRRS